MVQTMEFRSMNQTLKKAIREVEALPEDEQEELGRALLDMALRKKIDARLEAAVTLLCPSVDELKRWPGRSSSAESPMHRR
jgi:hypothetical protein